MARTIKCSNKFYNLLERVIKGLEEKDGFENVSQIEGTEEIFRMVKNHNPRLTKGFNVKGIWNP